MTTPTTPYATHDGQGRVVMVLGDGVRMTLHPEGAARLARDLRKAEDEANAQHSKTLKDWLASKKVS